jgi:LuxR family maltose regulon positive regulatory protein
MTAQCRVLPFDRLPAKVQVPAPRPGSVSRTALVNRLRAGRSAPVIAITAPAGYGKTTALAQWAERDERPFAWVSVDERDDDPAVLLRHLAAALEGCEQLDPSVLRAVRAPGKSLWTSAVPRLASALASLESPTVVVLDDAGVLRSQESIELLTVLAQHIGEGSTLALSGRMLPQLPIAQLRASGRLFEIGPELLALNRREAEGLLRASGVDITDEQVAALVELTEGWAAGLYIAALAIRDGGGRDAAVFTGDDRYLADYLRSACLSTLPPERLDFLRRTSMLEWMSGKLCDAVLETTEAAGELEALEGEGLFLVPLDHRREQFRYHGLFRDLLGRELEQHEAASVAPLHRRAAAWFETAGYSDAAISHAAAAGDIENVARLVGALALSECDAGRVAAVEAWLGFFKNAELDRYPAVAAAGAWVHALRGHVMESERWLAAAEIGIAVNPLPIGAASARPLIALVRAALCRDGVDRMRADAETAVIGLPVGDARRAQALVLLGVAQKLNDCADAADETLERAAEEARANGATATLIAALTERALVAVRRDDFEAAERLALEARAVGSGAAPAETAFGALAAVVSARVLLRYGHFDEARAELATAERLRPTVTRVIPWLGVQMLREFARARLALRDTDSARDLATEAAAILGRRPDLGVVGQHVGELRAELDGDRNGHAGKASRLTGAELRLLPLLSTHLSFREIGVRLYVSRNTIKTQAISVYRKLGVSSRSDAIAEAARLGLLAAPSTSQHPASGDIAT